MDFVYLMLLCTYLYIAKVFYYHNTNMGDIITGIIVSIFWIIVPIFWIFGLYFELKEDNYFRELKNEQIEKFSIRIIRELRELSKRVNEC